MSNENSKPPEPAAPKRAGRDAVVATEDRLDRALVVLAGSRARAAEALKAGRVLVDGQVVGIGDAGLVVAPGRTLTLCEAGQNNSRKALQTRRILEENGLGLIAEGRGFIAVNKPAGLLTDAATFKQKREETNATEIVAEYLLARHGSDVQALPAHRIDRDTSGVIVFATNPLTEAHLRDQFAARTPERVYLVAVRGKVEGDTGLWQHGMRWDADTNRQLPATLDEPGAVRAEASWKVLARIHGTGTDGVTQGDATLLEVRLVTGRRNQIRLQAALSGHPLLGERLYHPPRGKPTPRLPANAPDIGRQALHAFALHLVNPNDGQPLSFTASPPEDFTKLLKWFRYRVTPMASVVAW